MKETTAQIDGMMSIFDDAGVEKQVKHRERRGVGVKIMPVTKRKKWRGIRRRLPQKRKMIKNENIL